MAEEGESSRVDDVTEEFRQAWIKEQLELKEKLVVEDDLAWKEDGRPSFVGGLDISFVKDTTDALAALVVVEYPSMKVVYEDYQQCTMSKPYINGFLAFREVEHLVPLIHKCKASKPEVYPQLWMVDGNGTIHPRGLGIASHLGVLLGEITVGVAKKLCMVDGWSHERVKKEMADMQEEDKDGQLRAGASYALKHRALPLHMREFLFRPVDLPGGKVIGAMVRTADKPIFVSPGHRISWKTAVSIVQACCFFRIPEPIRQADLRSRDIIRNMKS
eukprot:CAMPEP_0113894188 /NCGR_PEP_ID=MMETSP0780_2-20120614/16553_1 /TAXON_ID=652834 /ORGANISM="Palpitomonas bilix" /LENGTH=273 /DNA_ID=CAMNT_0000884649 /DNA_START=86 /DNA_END=907 /DNA_ORIENTATION=- /assembly_acc=CAM_ASM_000599